MREVLALKYWLTPPLSKVERVFEAVLINLQSLRTFYADRMMANWRTLLHVLKAMSSKLFRIRVSLKWLLPLHIGGGSRCI